MATSVNKPLVKRPYEPLNWKGNFNPDKTEMVRIRTIGDGSCFFHAIADSFFIPYKSGQLDGKHLNRSHFIADFRRDLAKRLAQPVNPRDPSSPIYYDTLSRGGLREFSKSVPQYTLDNMEKELSQSSRYVDNIYNEFISDVLNKDIYLLDLVKQDVYVTGNDEDILHKGRDSIVILTMPGHYELVGVQRRGVIVTLFKHDDPFILSIRRRIDQLIKNPLT